MSKGSGGGSTSRPNWIRRIDDHAKPLVHFGNASDGLVAKQFPGFYFRLEAEKMDNDAGPDRLAWHPQ